MGDPVTRWYIRLTSGEYLSCEFTSRTAAEHMRELLAEPDRYEVVSQDVYVSPSDQR